MQIIFWSALGLIVYPYLIYPLIMVCVGRIRPRPVHRSAWLPSVTILIPAYNEVDCIGATIQNKLDLNYPADKMQIIVISDGSTDGSDDMIAGFSDPRVMLLRREQREGKAAALNAAVRLAKGEIIVFSDANSMFAKNALQRLTENFSDPQVGYVTGTLAFGSDHGNTGGAGVDAYMQYENLLRRIETTAGSIIGVNGGVDAIRADLYVDTPNRLITDFILPLTVIARKYRVIFDPTVLAYEQPNTALAAEFKMRVRVALRALQGLLYMRRLLHPLRYPQAAFCLLSHKVIRYLGFVFMLLALAANGVLASVDDTYRVLLALHLSAYGIALAGLLPFLPARLRRLTILPAYLVMSNAAFAVATVRFLRGDSMATWRPRGG